MKSPLHLFLLPALLAGLNFIPAGRVTAQTFTTLHNFADDGDQAYPYAGLVLSGSTLYGTAVAEGSVGNDTVFAVNTDGTGFTNLHRFIGSDRALLYAGLLLSGNSLYGAAAKGGSSGEGMVFTVNINGAGFTNLYSFIDVHTNAAYPYAGLIKSGPSLYGTASVGSSGLGAIFRINSDGTGFTNLHNFTGSDGRVPWAGLLLSDNTLYGTTLQGGSSGLGTVFQVNTDGAGFASLHDFSARSTNSSGDYTNSDGAEPSAGLILSGGTLYGTAMDGGSTGAGTVFALGTNGMGFRILHSFAATSADGNWTNSDGAFPRAGLILSGKILYGTTLAGGSLGFGTVFAVNADGKGFTSLHSFTGGRAGAFPYAGLLLSSNTLYGTTSDVFFWPNYGTVFSLSLTPPPPQLRITQFGVSPSGIILSWPTNVAGFDYSGFTLQSTTNLDSPAIWSTNSPAPVVVKGENTVTNPISGTRKFYRLSSQ
jgi:uncharacterized repeat protein (TIGR03803 family)